MRVSSTTPSGGLVRYRPSFDHGLWRAMVRHAFRNCSQLIINISENAWAVESRFTFSENVLPNIFQTQPQAGEAWPMLAGGQQSATLFGIRRNINLRGGMICEFARYFCKRRAPSTVCALAVEKL